MKRALACCLAFAISTSSIPLAAQSQGAGAVDTKGMDPRKDPEVANAHKGSGVVKSVDEKKGSVTIAHGSIQSMNWPAMTMAFAAKDRKMIEAIKPGTKVEFQFVQQGATYVITSIK